MSDPRAEDSGGPRSACRWLFRGKVQGVGFRPAVARCAAQLRLDGAVSNAGDGVYVELEGAPAALERFVDSLRAILPPQAEISAAESAPQPARGRRGFTLGDSNTDSLGPLRTRVPPDTRLCNACREEVRGVKVRRVEDCGPGERGPEERVPGEREQGERGPGERKIEDCRAGVGDTGDTGGAGDAGDVTARRGGYPFVSCVECGPRYSIVIAMPFDRPRTAMRSFPLCEDCAREYCDASDRRFHAQTNTCRQCGPQVRVLSDAFAGSDWLEAAAAALRAGAVVALRGVGGYQLLADPRQDDAVRTLRSRKARPDKPLAVLVPDLAAARLLANFGVQEAKLLASPANPIVVVRRRADALLSAAIHPGIQDIGLMLPTTPLHALLAERCGPLIATSANCDGEPLIYASDAVAQSDLRTLAELVVDHNRAIERPIDDSVARVIAGRTAVLRVGRGYAPLTLDLPLDLPLEQPLDLAFEQPIPAASRRPLSSAGENRRSLPAIVAFGGHQKAAFALFNGDQAVLGPHIGELDGEPGRRRYREQLEAMLALYGGRVGIVAHDAHPDYFTTRLAQEWRDRGGDRHAMRLIAVQHHHAHVAAAMAEHGLLSREVLGVAWDGTGWGPDGSIWGGEFLLATARGFRRVARLRPFALPGGERAVREPWRVAASLLTQAWDDPCRAARWLGERWNGSHTADGGTSRLMMEASARLACLPPQTGLAPWTSSAGRLFDGVAAIALSAAHGPLSYEGQAAAMWEATAGDARCTGETGDARDLGGSGDVRETGDAGVALANTVVPADPDYVLILEPSADQPALWELDWRPLVRAVARDVECARPMVEIAAAFHAALADAIWMVAERYASWPTVLSGGVFQNRRLVEQTAGRFAARGRWLGTPGSIPVNDGGLAAGQLAVAIAAAITGAAGTQQESEAT